MLGEELQRNIRDSWLRVRGKILSDPDELQRRLARRRSKSLTRPPRAWCIAIRASDRRITPAHWIITPEHALDLDHPAHPYEPIEHELTIQKHAIRRYCNPVSFSREDAVEVAKMLGTSDAHLWHARKHGTFYETLIRGLGGKRGHPVPLLSPNGQLFDPGFSRRWARPHPVWGADWEFLSHHVPDDFEQTVLRKPHFARVHKRSHHPADPPDFWGWRWICPACKKPVKSIYYPVPVRIIFDIGQDIPAWDAFTEALITKILCDDLPPTPPPSFACKNCHAIQYFKATSPATGWNQVVSHITAGLLYGHEVPRPPDFIPQRCKTRVRQLNRAAPIRRKVLSRLSNGWSAEQIALHLGISLPCARSHIYKLCREERVPNVQALAQKLNFAKPPVLCERAQRAERAQARRPLVQQMLLANCTYPEMAQKFGVSKIIIRTDVIAIYRAHGIQAKGSIARKRALAEKLGINYVSNAERIGSRVSELREQGLTWKQIGQQMGMHETTAGRYAQKLNEVEAAAAPKSVGVSLHP
jgi:transcriptional regulator with XRE-family HTH domain